MNTTTTLTVINIGITKIHSALVVSTDITREGLFYYKAHNSTLYALLLKGVLELHRTIINIFENY